MEIEGLMVGGNFTLFISLHVDNLPYSVAFSKDEICVTPFFVRRRLETRKEVDRFTFDGAKVMGTQQSGNSQDCTSKWTLLPSQANNPLIGLLQSSMKWRTKIAHFTLRQRYGDWVRWDVVNKCKTIDPLTNSATQILILSSSSFDDSTLGKHLDDFKLSSLVPRDRSAFKGAITTLKGDVHIKILETVANTLTAFASVRFADDFDERNAIDSCHRPTRFSKLLPLRCGFHMTWDSSYSQSLSTPTYRIVIPDVETRNQI